MLSLDPPRFLVWHPAAVLILKFYPIQLFYIDGSYSWGAGNLVKKGDPRTAYLSAIKAADKGDIKPLIDFGRA